MFWGYKENRENRKIIENRQIRHGYFCGKQKFRQLKNIENRQI